MSLVGVVRCVEGIVVAADSALWSYSTEEICGHVAKIQRLGDRALLAIAGITITNASRQPVAHCERLFDDLGTVSASNAWIAEVAGARYAARIQQWHRRRGHVTADEKEATVAVIGPGDQADSIAVCRVTRHPNLSFSRSSGTAYEWVVFGRDVVWRHLIAELETLGIDQRPLQAWEFVDAFAASVTWGRGERQPVDWPIHVGVVAPSRTELFTLQRTRCANAQTFLRDGLQSGIPAC